MLEENRFRVIGLNLSQAEMGRIVSAFQVGQWMLCSDETAERMYRDAVVERLTGFDNNTLTAATGIDSEVFELITKAGDAQANRAILAIIKSTCGLENFYEQLKRDGMGRGVFVSSFDCEELEHKTKRGQRIYCYRIG
jgi:hypothetical protein